jgi:hypothetical protein
VSATEGAGRALTPQPFTGDDGAADPGLAAALEAQLCGTGSTADVVAALAAARVLVAVVAVAGDVRVDADGPRSDARAEMALVTLTGPDGVRTLPVFSSVATLAAWDAGARPVPVESARAALAAVDEGCDRLVLDPAGPYPFVVRRPAVWALGQGRRWLPAPGDPDVVAAVRRVAGSVPDVVGVRCEPGGPAELRVVLGVRTGLDRARLDGVLAAVRAGLADDQLITDRVDSLELRVLPG